MKKQALRKDFYMSIRKSFGRFMSIFFIVALGVAFFSGIRSAEPDMRDSADMYFDRHKMMHLKVQSNYGMTKEDVEALEDVEGIAEVKGAYSADVLCMAKDNEKVLHVMSDLPDMNEIQVEEGRLPKKAEECLLDTDFMKEEGYEIGDKIRLTSGTDAALTETLKQDTYTIVGSGSSPFYISFERGSTSIGTGTVSGFAVLSPDAFVAEAFTEAYLLSDQAKEEIVYTKGYDKIVEQLKDRVEEVGEERTAEQYEQLQALMGTAVNVPKPQWYVTDRSILPEHEGYGENADRMKAIGEVFPEIFFLVAALISLTTMTRMVEEERVQIGTLKALGYGKTAIVGKYLKYAFLATLLGSILGVLIGEKILPYIIIYAYQIMYPHVPDIVTPYRADYALLATGAALLCTLGATLYACYKELAAQPAELMRPPAPKEGKRIFLEHIPFIWKRLSFIWKSSIRNLFRYKKRLFMTIVGVGGCMALMLVGFGLKDSIMCIGTRQYDEIQLYDGMIYLRDTKGEEARKQVEQTLDENADVERYTDAFMKHTSISKGKHAEDAYVVVAQDAKEMEAFTVFRDRKTQQSYHLQDSGAIVTEKLAKELKVEKGDTIRMEVGDREDAKVKISEICENYMGHYVYLSEGYYEQLSKEKPSYNTILFAMKQNAGMEMTAQEKGKADEKLEAAGEAVLKQDGVLNVTYMNNMEEQLSDMLQSLNLVIVVLIISAGMLAFVVLYNLNHINITERKRELATIKVLGFFDKEVGSYVYRENIVMTVMSLFFGMILGNILHRFIIVTVEVDMVMFGRIINWQSYLYSSLFTIGFSLIVNWVMYFKLKKIDMVESLKSVE